MAQERAREALAAIERAMKHRGPDDSGVEIFERRNGVIGLTATRLAIQDCSPRGHQPMLSPDGRRCIAFNGEIYNVEEVRSLLLERGHCFDGHSDTEVVLHAYEEWGPDCLGRLRGMFGLAIWDAPEDRLFLARDRIGIKPLYYQERASGIVFASEVRGLLDTGMVERRLAPEAVAGFLATGSVRDPLTMVEGVRALPAGHYAFWDDRGLRTTPYWSVADAFAPSDRNGDRRGAVEAIRSTLEEAVRQHLVSDVPLGVFLSGGIDSCALAGLVSAVAPEPPRTVSVVFPEREYSEEPYIRHAVERFGTDHRQVELTDAALLDRLPAALAAMDQPTVDGVNTYVVSQAAREAGLTVALAGIGGDELFAGYPSFRAVPLLHTAGRALPGPARTLAAAAVGRVRADDERSRKIAQWLREPSDLGAAYELHRELFASDRREALSVAATGAEARERRAASDPVNAVSMLELESYMRNMLLRDSDSMSMAHSLEVRVPLLDHRLIELVGQMPGAWKRSRKTPKPLLVEALSDILPDEIVYRRKMGFTFPFETWMRDGLREPVHEALQDAEFGGQVAGALDPAAVREVWDAFEAGRTNWSRPWAIYVLKSWAERHLGGSA